MILPKYLRYSCPSIFLTNARSILPKIDDLRLTASSVNADVIIVTESWLHSMIDSDLLHLNFFDVFRCDRVARRGGGVCMWVKKKFKPCIIAPFSDVPSAIEVIFIHITCVKLSIILCGIYVPPNLDIVTHLRITDFIISEFDRLLSLYPDVKVVMAGDFNDFRSGFLSEQFGFVNTVHDSTRHTAILDQIWIDNDLRPHYAPSATVGPPIRNSDHNCVLLSPVFESMSDSHHSTVVWDYRTSHISEYLRRLSCTDFTEAVCSTTVDDMCVKFYDALIWPLSAIPRHVVHFSSNDKPWITPVLKLLINLRWNAFREKNWSAYLHYKMKVKMEISKAKRIWSKKQSMTTRGLWTIVKEVRGSKQNDPWHKLIDEHGSLDVLLNLLSTEFSKNFNLTMDSELLSLEEDSWSISVSAECVYHHLSHLSSRKAIGPDGFPPKLLNIGAQFLCQPLAVIFNRSIETQTFPNIFKCANVCPIPKQGSTSVSNFRPISLLSPISKIFERIVLAHVKTDLISCFGSNQHAYRPLGSTTTALVSLCDHITTALDRKETTAVNVYCLDLSRAFDKLQHHRLINYLRDCGLDHGFLRWLLSYLQSRSMRVKVKNVLGHSVAIPSGVPQGSVLGPFLFSAFMGSIDFSSEHVKCVKYADDVTIVETVAERRPSSITFEDCEKMFSQKGLVLNKSKCKLLRLKRSSSCNVYSKSGFIEVASVKILGITLTDNFKWDSSITANLKNASRRLYIIRCLKNFLSGHELVNVYHALITSLLMYASPCYGRLPRTLLDKFEIFQKRAHRLICGAACNCPFFPSLCSKFEAVAVNLLLSSEAHPHHPLHSFVPRRLPRSGHFFIPSCSSVRRLNSFFPWASILYNVKL